MTLNDGFLLLVRWLHALAAVAWVGGGLFYVLVLRPVLKRGPQGTQGVDRLALQEFRGLVDTCIAILILTGAILTFTRLTPGFVGVPYVAVLSLKVALALGMFYLARGRRARGWRLPSPETPPTTAQSRRASLVRRAARAVSGANLFAILGITIVLLADLLRALYEQALHAR
ncbi:MAG: hypothetical protein HY686_09495 [Chloroflexi bacterium]|nr:hypothetical protein [Chloroflexota bacterium]